ncbi:MAG: (2Fe-2S)-binding protein [Deltaproteobacteria bacterium]|nr:(2Fe-2S)-binding protein [Deltaproteobacteria bacterium]
MKTITLTIDEKTVEATEGEMLLWVALDNDIYIPNLCALKARPLPDANCRLCWVDIEGRSAPVTACNEPVYNGMVVKTGTERVVRLQQTALELILSTHPVDCGRCGKNKRCELQKIARHLRTKLKQKRLRDISKRLPIDSSHSLFSYDPNKCVLCGRCIWVCKEEQKVGTLHFAYRGFAMVVTAFGGAPLGEADCTMCGRCVEVCPVGSLIFKNAEK